MENESNYIVLNVGLIESQAVSAPESKYIRFGISKKIMR